MRKNRNERQKVWMPIQKRKYAKLKRDEAKYTRLWTRRYVRFCYNR